MKIGLVGGTQVEWSKPFSPQRTVNLFPVIDQQGKEVAALYGTPGLSQFADIGTGEVRGGFKASNGRLFFVSGSKLYEVSAGGTGTERGTLDQSAGIIYLDENDFQLAINDGNSMYIFTYATNTFAKVSDPDLPSCTGVTFLDGYFITIQNNTGKYYISKLYDGTDWAALDFASAESSPDFAKRAIRGIGLLWIMGEKTTEIHSNTGDSVFPFSVIKGTSIDVGILAPASVVEVSKTLIMLGVEASGGGGVYQSDGFNFVKISTPPIDTIIQNATDFDNMQGYTYEEDGRKFYVLTGGDLETTLVYDLVTKIWHERAFTESQGNYQQHLGRCHVFAFNKHLVGSRVDGKIYEMAHKYYDDAGDEIVRERIYTNLSDEMRRIRYNKLEIGFETGVGLQSGQGSNPLCTLQISKDGGQTWSSEYQASIGRVGKYRTQASFRRLGIAEQVTFRLRISDPVKIAITGSYLS